MFATLYKILSIDDVPAVSIPFRGFRCLQRYLLVSKKQPQVGFQSLSGVLDVCNHGSAPGAGGGCTSFNPFQGF